MRRIFSSSGRSGTSAGLLLLSLLAVELTHAFVGKVPLGADDICSSRSSSYAGRIQDTWRNAPLSAAAAAAISGKGGRSSYVVEGRECVSGARNPPPFCYVVD